MLVSHLVCTIIYYYILVFTYISSKSEANPHGALSMYMYPLTLKKLGMCTNISARNLIVTPLCKVWSEPPIYGMSFIQLCHIIHINMVEHQFYRCLVKFLEEVLWDITSTNVYHGIHIVFAKHDGNFVNDKIY